MSRLTVNFRCDPYCFPTNPVCFPIVPVKASFRNFYFPLIAGGVSIVLADLFLWRAHWPCCSKDCLMSEFCKVVPQLSQFVSLRGKSWAGVKQPMQNVKLHETNGDNKCLQLSLPKPQGTTNPVVNHHFPVHLNCHCRGHSALSNKPILYPIGSMYAIYGNMYHQYTPFMLALIYQHHGSYGFGMHCGWPTRLPAGLFTTCSCSVVSWAHGWSMEKYPAISKTGCFVYHDWLVIPPRQLGWWHSQYPPTPADARGSA